MTALPQNSETLLNCVKSTDSGVANAVTTAPSLRVKVTESMMMS